MSFKKHLLPVMSSVALVAMSAAAQAETLFWSTQATRRLIAVVGLGEDDSRWRRDRMAGNAGPARQGGQGIRRRLYSLSVRCGAQQTIDRVPPPRYRAGGA